MPDHDEPKGMRQTASKESTIQEASDVATSVAESAKARAKSAVKDAKDEAVKRADGAKSSVADEMSGVASALRTAAEEMRSGSPQERTFGQIAESLADASEAVRNRDLGEMVEDVTAFARKNPLIFLGGAAVVGFAAARFGKASSRSGMHAGQPDVDDFDYDAGTGFGEKP